MARHPVDAIERRGSPRVEGWAQRIEVGLGLGVTTIDSAVGGLGGCPYAPGAAGNLATEDLVYMLHGMGIETGVDLDSVASASRALAPRLGHGLPSRYVQAGPPNALGSE